jgi:hypothetical protein
MPRETQKAMDIKTLGLIAVAAMGCSLSAHAQLKSVDNGAAAIDDNGLMWANTVGTNLTWSSTGAAGSAQAWVADLNASDYGGHNNWTLATGDGGFGPNTTTNQLGELFYSDCGNVVNTPSVLNNVGKNCSALSAVNTALNTNINGIENGSIFFSSSLYGTKCCGPNTAWWVYETPDSSSNIWNSNSNFGFLVGVGDALAVRPAPEIDPTSAGSGLVLLFGSLFVLRGRRFTGSVKTVG